MTPHDDKLLAVLRNPADNAPRLAYAAESEPRGRLIRAQIALLNTDPAEERERRSLAEESRDLIRQYGPAWAGAVGDLVESYQFERGFVGLVYMTARDFLGRAPQLFSLAPILHLDLREVRGVSADLFASPYLRFIRSLAMEECGLRDDDARLLAASPHLTELRWLSLQVNHIGRLGCEAIAASRGLPRLRYANFAANDENPGQQFSYDQGYVADEWISPFGQELERRYGPLPWLHVEGARTADDIPPDRFLMGLR